MLNVPREDINGVLNILNIFHTVAEQFLYLHKYCTIVSDILENDWTFIEQALLCVKRLY